MDKLDILESVNSSHLFKRFCLLHLPSYKNIDVFYKMAERNGMERKGNLLYEPHSEINSSFPFKEVFKSCIKLL